MTELDTYLSNHYLDEHQLAAAAGLQPGELDALVRDRLVPAPAYVVTESGTLVSFVFGEMPSPGSRAGRFFPPSQLTWIERARRALAADGAQGAEARLKERFSHAFAGALGALNLTTWRLRDSFSDKGEAIESGLRARTDTAWTYFLNGTFGLCVANPVSEAHIAHKEVLQEKLASLSANGTQSDYAPAQKGAMLELIDAYAAASMPFSPVEYARSSRKRLVDDLREKIHACRAAA